jgi:hypothetical protein
MITNENARPIKPQLLIVSKSRKEFLGNYGSPHFSV